MSLGRRTLRADAAPVAAISVLQFLWGDLIDCKVPRFTVQGSAFAVHGASDR